MFENPETVNALDLKLRRSIVFIQRSIFFPSSHGLLFRTHSSRKLINDGPHPPTPSSSSLPGIPDCGQHTSSVYAQLGSPVVDFHSFWTVYNTLHDVVHSGLLSSCTVDDPEGKNASEGSADIVRLPPSSLCKWSPSHSDCTARR
jgi:hypothetical protein